jgi:alpha-beta hydrolase superfamily lysophospholipase
MIDKIVNDTFMAKFDKRTPFEWLSSDKNEVDKYISDPYCGTLFTVSFYRDLFTATERVNSVKSAELIVPTLKIHLISGEKDPVGDYGKGVTKVKELYDVLGLNVSMKLYNGVRHELINEINKEEVYLDILSKLDEWTVV